MAEFESWNLPRNKLNYESRSETCEDCAPGEARTPDLMIRSHSLYPTELRARPFIIRTQVDAKIKQFRYPSAIHQLQHGHQRRRNRSQNPGSGSRANL